MNSTQRKVALNSFHAIYKIIALINFNKFPITLYSFRRHIVILDIL